MSKQDYLSRIAKLTARRRAIVERQELLQGSPPPRDEVEASIARTVAAAAAAAELPVQFAMARDGRGVTALFQVLRDRLSRHTSGVAGVLEVLCAVIPDAMTEWLGEQLSAKYATLPKPVGAEEYGKQAAAIAAELATVDGEAAEVWWEAIDAGVELPPPEIPAAAILGLA